MVLTVLVLLALPLPSAAAAAPACGVGARPKTSVGPPASDLAWRATPLDRAVVYRGIPGAGGRRIGSIDTNAADWLLVLGAAQGPHNRCWVKVRLPGRPNDAAGWLDARQALMQSTPWRLEISLAARTLTVYRAGRQVRSFSTVIGAPSTPTPRGLFSIVHAWRGNANDFVGSWILGLTAHSNVLRRFEGGEGEVGIHGRGGASLLDPLGSAASHGCIRLANHSIDALVRMIGTADLPGIPIRVS